MDSAVVAALVHRAVGDQLTCIFVDHGFLRKNEAEQVVQTFGENFHVNLIHVQAQERFLERLKGVIDPEEKRRMHRAGVRGRARGGSREASRTRQFLAQGTLYPDVIESGTKQAARIKTHHNVGGLPETLKLKLVEPLRYLFKDEVRAVGEELGLAGRDRLAASLPRAGAGDPHPRRGHGGAPGHAAGGRRRSSSKRSARRVSIDGSSSASACSPR